MVWKALSRAPASGRKPSAAHRTILRQKCCLTPRTDTASDLTPGQSVSSSIPSSSVGRLSKRRTSKKYISKYLELRANTSSITNTNSHHTGTYLSTHVSSCSRSLRPIHKSALHYTTFTSGIIPGFTPISAREMPPDFRHISPLVSRANLSRLRQACQLDGGDPTASPENIEPPALSASSSSSLVQKEREFQKAVQPGSPISTLLSSAQQPLMVVPGGTARGEPTLLRKLQAAKKEAATTKSPAKSLKASSRLQGISE